jgi:putative addiction module CopG family antidote
MELSLNQEIERFIEQEVGAGRYATPEGVVHAGVSKLMQRERLEGLAPEELEAIFPGLRSHVAAGLEEARAGKLSDGEAFFEELEREEERPADAARRTA